METDDRDGWGVEKMDRGEVKKVGSDEVQRYREDNAHTGRERGKGKWADRDWRSYGEDDGDGWRWKGSDPVEVNSPK